MTYSLLNSTNRKKIDKQDMASLNFVNEGDSCRLVGEIELKDFASFSPNSKLELAVVCGRYFEEYTIHDCKQKISIDQSYKGISTANRPKIRACVYENDAAALIKASGSFLPKVDDTSTKGLIGVKTGTFKYPLWKLALADIDEDGVYIEVSKDVQNRDELVRSDEFLALVFPEVIGRVLKHILLEGDGYSGSYLSGNEDQDKWIRWAFTTLPGVSSYVSDAPQDEMERWIDEIKVSFTKTYLPTKLSMYTEVQEEEG